MSNQSKIFADFTWDNYRNDNDEPQRREIVDLDDASQYGTQGGAAFFTLSEADIIQANGKTFTAEAEDKPGKHYLKADKLYTPQQAITQLHRDAKNPGLGKVMAELSRHGMKKEAQALHQALLNNPLEEEFRKAPATTRYVKLPYSGFAKLGPEDCAYDSSGNKVWPEHPAPAASIAPPEQLQTPQSPKLPKPSDRFKLK